MTEQRNDQTSIGIREIVRWWPLIIVMMLIAGSATIWSQSRQVPSYTATTRVVVVPLAQWDETFLGTRLVRDSGDATRTAATVAAELNSIRAATVTADALGGGWTPDSVAAAVKVSVFEETNVIEIVARSEDADKAVKLAEGFANATIADRWRAISAELDARIATITDGILALSGGNPDNGAANPIAEQESARLQTLKMVRDAGSDPTMRLDSTSLAVRIEQMPIWAILGLATAGGLFVGVLAAFGMAMLRRPTDELSEESPLPAPAMAYSPNSGN